MHAMACASERRIPKGRFPTRPRFFLGGGVGGCKLSLFVLWKVGVGVVAMAT